MLCGRIRRYLQTRSIKHEKENGNLNIAPFVADSWKDVEGSDSIFYFTPNNEYLRNLECIICMRNCVSVILLPCFHAQLCINCANNLKTKRKCPTCLSSILTPKKLYF